MGGAKAIPTTVIRGFSELVHLPWLGIVLGVGLGSMGLFAPGAALGFVGLKEGSPEARGEVRATYGGFFLALEIAAAVFWSQSEPAGVVVAGVAWLGAAAGRLVSLAVDGGRTGKNLAAVAFEGIIGVLHLPFGA